MNYPKIYNSLMIRGSKRFNGVSISKAKKVIPFYVERHRILPGCMGGKYVEGNVAWLTPEEHFVAHQLLVKMHPKKYKLLFAAVSMSNLNISGKRGNNKLYGWLKKKLSETQSKRMKGENNPVYGKHWKLPPMPEEVKRKHSMPGKMHPMYGKIPHNKGKKGVSAETSKKMSKAKENFVPSNKGVPCSSEQKENLSNKAMERFKDKRNHPMYGRIHPSKGLKFYNNGKEQRLFLPGTQPTEYKSGRL